MAATVIPFPSQDRNPAPTCCPRCELDALADRVQLVLDNTTGELLIPREALAAVHADLIATTHRLLPPDARSKP